ncbi:tRNA (N6-isopentenyl adenosine(37)-C2)-methylthiotransferase MiaB [Alienimonas sp. DA493]|uniref:tRNA (N6-isopentenyl adenosine(37)-C2)-methylthiotransferase MiaB n=1 Tax=Alienimonas sp. DA493 TaxID=3373605 RepID=UPI00375515FC
MTDPILPAAAPPADGSAADGPNRRLYIETVGCQMNVLDSELVVGALRKRGFEVTSDPDAADTLLFNTCSVREKAEQKIYSSLGRLKYRKRKRPGTVIGVLGCMAQKDKDLVFRKMPHVDLVVGTGQLAEVPDLIDAARENALRGSKSRLTALSLSRKGGARKEIEASFESYDPLREPTMRPTPHQAFVRVMIGCDKFCTYCVVPSTRGPEQSRAPSDVLKEVQVLAGQGVKEITLLGQTVNSYKHSGEGKTYRLSDLLYLIHDTPGVERIKFVTGYPRDLGDDLLEAIRDLKKCYHYLHVPLQSGCDDVLKVMKRGYTVEQYRDMMHRVWETVPGCSVSSDFIVGHPGETEESFEKSVDSVREFRFKNSFIFKYSPRPGTKAHERLADDVPDEVKRRRNNELLAVQNEVSEEENARKIGEEVSVLVEGPSVRQKKTDEPAAPGEAIQLTGRTRCDRIVVFDGNPRLIGSTTQVHVDDCTGTTLIGSIVTREVTHLGGLPVLV